MIFFLFGEQLYVWNWLLIFICTDQSLTNMIKKILQTRFIELISKEDCLETVSLEK